MTTSATATRELVISDIVLRAYQVAGLVTVGKGLSTAQQAFGQDLLEVIVDHLQSYGFSARAVAFYDLPLTAGTYRYDLPTTVQETIGPAMYIEAGTADLTQASGETVVTKIGRETWQTQSSKDASGRPTMYYEHRDPVGAHAWFWPIPDEAGTVRFQYHRLLGDNDIGTDTVDLERYWVKCLIYSLAHDLALASSLPETRCMYLRAVSESTLAHARSQSRDQGDLVLHHATIARWR